MLLRAATLLLCSAEICAITVQGGTHHAVAEIDPDEFLWEKLPGRCCFAGFLDEDLDTWLGAETCSECNSWSESDNYCHKSKEACLKCGKALYCEPPPPLITGNVVCTGRSRVGTGCYDEIDTGICGTKGLPHCQQACRGNPRCQLLVYFTDKKAGSCVLCRDLSEVSELTSETTRVYASTPAPPPPRGPNKGKEWHFHRLSGPSPPPPPHPPPRRPSRPPSPLKYLREHGQTHQHFDCSFFPRIEFTVDTALGYTDRVASSREECCSFCGLKAGCQDFVFEPSSGTCVLLPHVSDSRQIIRTPNEYTVAGSISITVAKQEALHGFCVFKKETGFAQGFIGEAKRSAADMPTVTLQDCCDACDRDPKCAKFTFEHFSHSCMLYEAFAQSYKTPSLTSGTITTRMPDAGLSDAQLARHGSFLGPTSPHDMGYGYLISPPPAPPAFLGGWLFRSPPPPPLSEDLATKRLVAGFSLGMGGLFVLGFTLCAYCFFSSDLLRAMHAASGGRFGKPNAVPHSRLCSLEPAEPRGQAGRAARVTAGSKANVSKREQKRKQRNGACSMADNIHSVNVTVETAALTQKKQVIVDDDSISMRELYTTIFDEFQALLQNKRHSEMLLLCLVQREIKPELAEHSDDCGDDDNDDATGKKATEHSSWLLVTSHSNMQLVLACPALKMIAKPQNHLELCYEHAFVPTPPPKPARKPAQKQTPRRGTTAEDRFADTPGAELSSSVPSEEEAELPKEEEATTNGHLKGRDRSTDNTLPPREEASQNIKERERFDET
mmetsp:Transcript_47528/g.78670  ORF Transcript_47528/g.78670 Transcript_47528/m.78670 type:complete len:780 (+) Transcript_47528:43-2382(+)